MLAGGLGGVATLAAPPAAAAARCTSAALNALHAAQDSKEAPIEASARRQALQNTSTCLR
jgi:hypothetical protein